MSTDPRPPRCREHTDHVAGCPPCRARSAWERRARLREGPRTVAPDLARARLAELRAGGMSLAAIAARSGLTRRHLQEIAAGIPKRCLRVTLDALVGVELAPTPRYLPAVGVSRRLRALSFIGYTWAQVGAELGVSWRRVWHLAHRSTQVTPDLRQRVAAVYTRLAWEPPPAGATARQVADAARRKGWHGPIAWEGDAIDDPAAAPAELELEAEPVDECDGWDHGRVELALAGAYPGGKLPTAERVYVVTQLARWHDDETIAARLRMTREAIAKFRERHTITARSPRRSPAAAELEAA